MKKIIALILILVCIASVSGCGKSVDYDLTNMDKHAAIDFINGLTQNTEANLGKVIKITGVFGEIKTVTRSYYTVSIVESDHGHSATIEFILENEEDGYPEVGATITVIGEFSTYKEGINTYCQLSNATITVIE